MHHPTNPLFTCRVVEAVENSLRRILGGRSLSWAPSPNGCAFQRHGVRCATDSGPRPPASAARARGLCSTTGKCLVRSLATQPGLLVVALQRRVPSIRVTTRQRRLVSELHDPSLRPFEHEEKLLGQILQVCASQTSDPLRNYLRWKFCQLIVAKEVGEARKLVFNVGLVWICRLASVGWCGRHQVGSRLPQGRTPQTEKRWRRDRGS
mmetsp:Transcript_87015/g.243977  ORF Transcript_87015/g.243977 Transcript_87015/m.243977 type:complete len:208 (+) Transcript_87015:235-858(+)